MAQSGTKESGRFASGTLSEQLVSNVTQAHESQQGRIGAVRLFRCPTRDKTSRSCDNELVEEIPESVAELFDDANGDLAVGDLPSAVEKYRKCTVIEPTFFDGWHALGMALMKNGQYPEAIEAGSKAVELRPNDQLAWSSLSLFYVRNHQIKEAEAASGKAKILSWGGKIVRDTKE